MHDVLELQKQLAERDEIIAALRLEIAQLNNTLLIAMAPLPDLDVETLLKDVATNPPCADSRAD
jgi:hypothetical protein